MDKKRVGSLYVIFVILGVVLFLLLRPSHGLKAINPECYNDNPKLKAFAIEFKHVDRTIFKYSSNYLRYYNSYIPTKEEALTFSFLKNLQGIKDPRVIDILLEGLRERRTTFNSNFFKEAYRSLSSSSYIFPPVMIDQAVGFRTTVIKALGRKKFKEGLDLKPELSTSI